MAFWCVNFDGASGPLGGLKREYVLEHGLAEQSWLMQYQYRHHGHTYQGHTAQLAATKKNWRAAGKVKPGDWLVAYLPTNRFYAVGQVINRRFRPRHHNRMIQLDTIERTTSDRTHTFFDGLVEYADSGAMYEDFTGADAWSLPVVNPRSIEPEVWLYPQRIDVETWLHVVGDGVMVPVLHQIPVHQIQLSVFEIPESTFNEIRNALQQRTLLESGGAFRLPEEAVDGTVIEGAIRRVEVNAYERDPSARRRCIEAHGTNCCVCGFNFGAVYGPEANGYIHVHHLRPLSEVGASHQVDPVQDLRPVCPNCHAVLHRKNPPYSIEEVREFIRQNSG